MMLQTNKCYNTINSYATVTCNGWLVFNDTFSTNRLYHVMDV